MKPIDQKEVVQKGGGRRTTGQRRDRAGTKSLNITVTSSVVYLPIIHLTQRPSLTL